LTLAAGTQFGRYEIRSPLGVGGMGEVYLANDKRLDRLVALKILPSEAAHDRERMNRFIREAQTASGLNHPNIITIYEIEEFESTYFITTEFVDGETLRDRITRTALTIPEVLDIGIQISAALLASHEAGIVHRDIKPENVMRRSRDGIVKVLDFGLAKFIEASKPIDTEAATVPFVDTQSGIVMGTTSYMSPEQARGLEVDRRTDIWSLGVVLYEMITGRAPFSGQTASDVLASILQKEFPPLEREAKMVPETLEWIVSKMLRKNREERYQTVAELITDLKDVKHLLERDAEVRRSAQTGLSTEMTTPVERVETAAPLTGSLTTKLKQGNTPVIVT
jgi:eukaryotic-like serine/threonine-protein kinase